MPGQSRGQLPARDESVIVPRRKEHTPGPRTAHRGGADGPTLPSLVVQIVTWTREPAARFEYGGFLGDPPIGPVHPDRLYRPRQAGRVEQRECRLVAPSTPEYLVRDRKQPEHGTGAGVDGTRDPHATTPRARRPAMSSAVSPRPVRISSVQSPMPDRDPGGPVGVRSNLGAGPGWRTPSTVTNVDRASK